MDKPEYTPPLDPELAALVDALDAECIEFFSERAAIIEYCGGALSRGEAEAAAWAETLRYRERRKARAMDTPDRRKDQK